MMDVHALSSYVEDRWLGAGGGRELLSAIDSSAVATMPRDTGNFGDMLRHARDVGGPALRAMTFQERGKLVRSIADALSARKEELYALSFATGATRNDSAVDIEGGIGALFVYASKAKALPAARVMLDGGREAISKGDFAGQHILTPLRGAAIHINAYNFPVWGMLEKLGPTLIAGMPAIVKPATATAWLTAAAFRIIVDSGVLPSGVLQLLLGTPGDLFDHLDGQDAVAFTGSAETAAKLRTHPTVVRENVRFAAEQDSLNACILGPDAGPGTPEFDMFVREVVREMTQKAGQKCTAIRRALVPAAWADAAEAALAERLGKIAPVDPRRDNARMGALAGLDQRETVRLSLAKLKTEARVVAGGELEGTSAEHSGGGAFFPPTLLRCDTPSTSSLVHEIEAFGPVATLMPYRDLAEATELARRGKGSLVLSLFSHDPKVVGEVVLEVASSHGRLLIVDRDSAEHSTGHGAALPHLLHGGPGRAGGGEELGGLIGLKHYMQRTAVQAASGTLDQIAAL